MEKEILNLMDKIKTASELLNTVKDYIEILKVSPKLKQTFNTNIINEQILLNENEINELSNKLQSKSKEA